MIMKRKFIVFALTGLILMMGMLAGCGSESDDSGSGATGSENTSSTDKSSMDITSDDDSIITINISDEAKAYRDSTLTEDGGDKVFLEEGIYEWIIMYLNEYPRTQIFPDCETQNELGCEEIAGCDVYTLSDGDYENVVLYTHGGGWVFEISEEHIQLCDALATRLNAKVYMPLYPLAPEADSEETYAAIEGIYKELVKQGKNVYIMGDSAGGNITLGLMHTIKEEGLQAPEKMVLIAPCSDMTFTNEEITTVAETDPVLAVYGAETGAEIWAGSENLKDPKYSAVYADVSGYPDTMIFQGTDDILGPDNIILYQNMKEAGVNVTLVKGEGLWHVFPIYPIPERDQALDLIEEFCAE